MKICLIAICFASFSSAWAKDYGYLKKEDQKFFQNDIMEGRNDLERISRNVKEINQLHAEINAMKADIKKLQNELMELKLKLKVQ